MASIGGFLGEGGNWGGGDRDFTKYGCLAIDWTWFKNMCEFASHLNYPIVLNKRHHLQSSRAGDCPTMELFI